MEKERCLSIMILLETGLIAGPIALPGTVWQNIRTDIGDVYAMLKECPGENFPLALHNRHLRHAGSKLASLYPSLFEISTISS
jgi:hypothetical protein